MSRYDSIATSQFYKDTGFDLVCSWLSENCLSSLNKNNFKNLKPDVDYLLIQDIQKNTEENYTEIEKKDTDDLNLMKELITQGISLDSKNNDGETALMIAIRRENLNLVKNFLANPLKLHLY